MMPKVLPVIKQRKSVRLYADTPVTEDQLTTLLDAGMCAPSSKNNQPWLFYVITNTDVLLALSTVLPFGKMISKVPAAIVVCGDNTKGVTEPDQALNWALDCSAASQNILLTAESIGLGAVWVGVFPYQERVAKVQEILNLPVNIVPLNVLPIGYPAKTDGQPKNKFNPNNIIWVK